MKTYYSELGRLFKSRFGGFADVVNLKGKCAPEDLLAMPLGDTFEVSLKGTLGEFTFSGKPVEFYANFSTHKGMKYVSLLDEDGIRDWIPTTKIFIGINLAAPRDASEERIGYGYRYNVFTYPEGKELTVEETLRNIIYEALNRASDDYLCDAVEIKEEIDDTNPDDEETAQHITRGGFGGGYSDEEFEDEINPIIEKVVKENGGSEIHWT